MPAVRKRLLFYFPGYDPDAKRRYRTLFMRELRRYVKRFETVESEVSNVIPSNCEQIQTWTVQVGKLGQVTKTTYSVMLWDDLVRRDMARSPFATAILNARALLHVACNGTLFRFYRASWKCANLIIYPFVTTLLLLGCLVLLIWLSYTQLSSGLGFSPWVTLVLGTAIGLAGLRGIAPLLERAFLWQLMCDGIFHWQHANRRRPDYLARLELFAEHLRAEIREIEADEILLVGHSTGALTAAEVAARLLTGDEALGRDGPALSLLTLGSSLPMVALQPSACSIRREIEILVASQRLTWVDYQAPQDWMSFPGFEPSRDLHLQVTADQIANPIVRSSKFREIVGPETYRTIDRRPLLTHFQFLMSNDRAGIFDIFALTLGPKCLRDRVMSEDSSSLADFPVPEGNIDEARHDYIRGWAYNPSSPDDSIELEIFINQVHVKRIKADLWRHDLHTEAIGCALHGFIWPIDPPLDDSQDQMLVVRRRADNFEIGRVVLRSKT